MFGVAYWRGVLVSWRGTIFIWRGSLAWFAVASLLAPPPPRQPPPASVCGVIPTTLTRWWHRPRTSGPPLNTTIGEMEAGGIVNLKPGEIIYYFPCSPAHPGSWRISRWIMGCRVFAQVALISFLCLALLREEKSVACCKFQIWIVARLKPLGDVLCLIPIMILGIHFVYVWYLGTSYCSEVWARVICFMFCNWDNCLNLPFLPF